MWSMRSCKSGNSSASPSISRLAISRRNTPDLQAGSRKVTLLSCQMSSGSISSIWLATSGGVNTSSLLRFARQVRTSGLYTALKKSRIVLHPPVICQRKFSDRGGDERLDFLIVLPAYTSLFGIIVHKFMQHKIPALDLVPGDNAPFGKDDGGAVGLEERQRVAAEDIFL